MFYACVAAITGYFLLLEVDWRSDYSSLGVQDFFLAIKHNTGNVVLTSKLSLQFKCITAALLPS